MFDENRDSLHLRRLDHDDRDLRGCTRDSDNRRWCRASPPAGACGARRQLMLRRDKRRGLLWLVGAFVICPCHLPVTLALLGALVAGTGITTWHHGHVRVAIVITVAWAAATWRGLELLRSAGSRGSR